MSGIVKRIKRSDHQFRVHQLMMKLNMDVPVLPMIPDEKIRIRRAEFIIKKALEVCKALGTCCVVSERVDVKNFNLEVQAPIKPENLNLVSISEALCDLRFVTTIALTACGLPDETMQEEMDNANLRKHTKNEWCDEDGVWHKYNSEPRTKQILAEIVERGGKMW